MTEPNDTPDERHFVSVTVNLGDPHNDQMAARANEELDQALRSTRNMLDGAEMPDKSAAMAAVATAFIGNPDFYPSERLASMLAAALLRLAAASEGVDLTGKMSPEDALALGMIHALALEDAEARGYEHGLAQRSGEQVPGLRYLLWDMERQMWWAPARRGYTEAIDEAGRYSQAEAVDLALQGSLGGLHHATVIVADHGSVKR